MKKILAILFFVGVVCTATAQEFADVMRYSRLRQGGTARSMGMGGAIGATGIDYSVSSINPAALAQLRNNTIMATLGLNLTNTNANYLNRDVTDNRFNFSMNNLGITITNFNYRLGKERKTGLISHTFSFGFDRVNDFNRNITLDSENSQSSYLDYLANQANKFLNWDDITQNGIDPFFPEELALTTNAIVYSNASDSFVPNLPNTINMRQLSTYNYTGRQNDWNIAWAGNFSHRLYLGASLGIPTIRFNATEKFIEKGYDEDIQAEKSFDHERKFSTSGTGINMKLGAVLRANNWLRIGLAYHTPTAYSLTDQFSYNFSSRGFANGNFNYAEGTLRQSEPAENSYSITIPGKLIFSSAIIIKKQAIISFDYESVNYASARISGDDLDFINPIIRSNLGATDNLRAGFEYSHFDYRFRAGYSWYSSPFNQSIRNSITEGNLALRVYSAGVGYQDPNSSVYFDAAVVFERFDDFTTPYTLPENTRAFYSSFNQTNSTRLIFTIGSRF